MLTKPLRAIALATSLARRLDAAAISEEEVIRASAREDSGVALVDAAD